ncbi:FAD-dependent oxidoreductase [uncultured Jatrophihabitans sp.]|uniref:FAD-dependent oxidoreductase n=1 Tax=uncultured Jatrophihabitans sp. TaxID=1610747 RepID=UPI0035CC3C66
MSDANPIEKDHTVTDVNALGAVSHPTVLVVGAGPTGLTLACQLAVRGVPVRVIDAAPGPQPGSRGKGIQPRTLEVFEDLGIIDTVLAHGQLAMPMRVTGPDGASVLRGIDIPPARTDVPYQTRLITPQWRIEETLRDLLTSLGGVVEFGTTLIRIEQAPGTVSAILARDGRTETVTVDWLVGCDGGRSTVRKQAGITFDGETLEDVRMIVADVEATGLDRDAWHMWIHREGMVNLCPLPSTDLFQYQAGIADGQNPDLDLANLQAILEQRSGRSDIRLRQPLWRTLWRANVRLVDRYRVGRVFLAGDAAHVHSPAGGQGMNTGIQDAYNLAWKLAAVVNGAPQTLLDTYDAERRPIAAGVLALSNDRLRQTLRTNAIPTRRDATTMQLDVGYRGSVLAQDDRAEDARLRAGDRAPDATEIAVGAADDSTHRLFDLLRGPHFTLLAFGSATAPADHGSDVHTLRVVTEPAAATEIADTAGFLTQSYDAVDGTLALIRPDGYIGLISDAGDQTAVAGYLAKIS